MKLEEFDAIMAEEPKGGWQQPPRPAVPVLRPVENPPKAVSFLSAAKENRFAERNFESTNEGSLTLPFAPLSSLLRDVPPEPKWLWDGYIAPEWITLISGSPKVGKSTLVFGLVGTLAEGGTFLDRAVTRAGVLLLSEERRSSLAEKDARWRLGERGVRALLHAETGGMEWPTVVALATIECHRHGLGVLVVDTWGQWTGLLGDDENNAGAVLQRMQPLAQAASTGLAVVLVAHDRKTGGKHGSGVRGSNALAGAVDIILQLERPGEELAREGVRVLSATSRSDKTPEELALALTEQGYAARGDAASVKAELDADRILDALRGAGQATTDELAEMLAIPRGTVRERCIQLHRAEKVGRTGTGKRGSPHVWHSEFLSASPDSLAAESNLRLPVDEAPPELAVHFSSATDEWPTPQDLFDEQAAIHGFTLDVCATAENAKCERFFTREDDGLAQDWTGVCWMNPPYGREIGQWMQKAYESSLAGATVVCLVPARTDTRWWHDYATKGEIEFLKGRLKFGEATNSAPFPSALVVFRGVRAGEVAA